MVTLILYNPLIEPTTEKPGNYRYQVLLLPEVLPRSG